MVEFVGIDGARGGWICAHISSGNQLKFELHSTIQKAWDKFSNADLVLIDIPIGLIEKGSESRRCDSLARKNLRRPRSSSIFNPPCRKALYMMNYSQANAVNRKWTKKGLSKQSWNILPKIKEVDSFLHKNLRINIRLWESHPELCFWAFNNERSMKYNKKIKEGYKERLKLLQSRSKGLSYDLNKILKQFPSKYVLPDDILDSWVLVLTAKQTKSKIRSFPSQPDSDSIGLPMRIVCAKNEN